MSGQRRQSDSITSIEDTHVVSATSSILRNVGASRPPLSEAPSVVISLPDEDREKSSPEQQHRRRLRFLEMRREHYSQMHQHTEQCTMSEGEEQEVPRASLPETEDTNEPK